MNEWTVGYNLFSAPDGFNFSAHFKDVNVIVARNNKTSGKGKKKKFTPAFSVAVRIETPEEEKNITSKEPLIFARFFVVSFTCRNPSETKIPKVRATGRLKARASSDAIFSSAGTFTLCSRPIQLKVVRPRSPNITFTASGR